MTWNRFEDIEAWQMARAYNKTLYELIYRTEIRRHFSLKDQMLRATGSIMDNIAEGFERGSTAEFRSFLSYAKGSCGEARSQLYRCFDQKLISYQDFTSLKKDIEHIAGKIYRIIAHLNTSKRKGQRFE
jgi:four helix bundle protein